MNNKNICGIRNYGYNCYFNSGLQIIARCDEFINEIKKYGKHLFIDYLNDAISKILTKKLYEPFYFFQFYCNINKESIYSQNCSQSFIRNLIKIINDIIVNSNFRNLIFKESIKYHPKNKIELNEYNNFIFLNKIFPQSKPFSIFSGLTKSYSNQIRCKGCGGVIENYSFNQFIDFNIYLDIFKTQTKFSIVLKENLGKEINVMMDCPYVHCNKELILKERTKIIKLPNILIFTLERYFDHTNNVLIEPDEIIDMKDYVDESLKKENTLYELFAINIRLGRTKNFGHQFCEVKINKQWYEINDDYIPIQKNKPSSNYFNLSSGLFYIKK